MSFAFYDFYIGHRPVHFNFIADFLFFTGNFYDFFYRLVLLRHEL